MCSSCSPPFRPGSSWTAPSGEGARPPPPGARTDVSVLGIDRDGDAVAAARDRLEPYDNELV